MAVLGVDKWDGSIRYNTNNPSWPNSSSGGGGGISGGGTIWSSVSQVIWIRYDGAPAYPVYLKPGNNEVHFWIPTIFPDDEWIEAKLEIETPGGYILIPAGFEWDILTGENVPPPPPNDKRIDKIKFKDFYDIFINYAPPTPSSNTDIIDEYSYVDIVNNSKNKILKLNNNIIDTYNYNDMYDVEIINIPTPTPTSIELSNIDEASFIDMYNTVINKINSNSNKGIDSSGYTDIYNIELN